jgi:hypothetical protein
VTWCRLWSSSDPCVWRGGAGRGQITVPLTVVTWCCVLNEAEGSAWVPACNRRACLAGSSTCPGPSGREGRACNDQLVTTCFVVACRPALAGGGAGGRLGSARLARQRALRAGLEGGGGCTATVPAVLLLCHLRFPSLGARVRGLGSSPPVWCATPLRLPPARAAAGQLRCSRTLHSRSVGRPLHTNTLSRTEKQAQRLISA